MRKLLKRISKRRISKRRISKRRISKRRISKKRISKKRISKKRISKRRIYDGVISSKQIEIIRNINSEKIEKVVKIGLVLDLFKDHFDDLINYKNEGKTLLMIILEYNDPLLSLYTIITLMSKWGQNITEINEKIEIYVNEKNTEGNTAYMEYIKNIRNINVFLLFSLLISKFRGDVCIIQNNENETLLHIFFKNCLNAEIFNQLDYDNKKKFLKEIYFTEHRYLPKENIKGISESHGVTIYDDTVITNKDSNEIFDVFCADLFLLIMKIFKINTLKDNYGYTFIDIIFRRKDLHENYYLNLYENEKRFTKSSKYIVLSTCLQQYLNFEEIKTNLEKIIKENPNDIKYIFEINVHNFTMLKKTEKIIVYEIILDQLIKQDESIILQQLEIFLKNVENVENVENVKRSKKSISDVLTKDDVLIIFINLLESVEKENKIYILRNLLTYDLCQKINRGKGNITLICGELEKELEKESNESMAEILRDLDTPSKGPSKGPSRGPSKGSSKGSSIDSIPLKKDEIKELEINKNIRISMLNSIEKLPETNYIIKLQIKKLSEPFTLNTTTINNIFTLINKNLKQELNADLMNIIFANGRFIDSIDLVYGNYVESIKKIDNFIKTNSKKKILENKKIKNKKTFTADNFEHYGDIIMDIVLRKEADEIFNDENTTFRNIYITYYSQNSVFSCIFDRLDINNKIYELMKIGCLILPLGGDKHKLKKPRIFDIYADYFEAFVFGLFLQKFTNDDEKDAIISFNNTIEYIKKWICDFDSYKKVRYEINNWFSYIKNNINTKNSAVNNSELMKILISEYENCGYSIAKS